MTIRDPQSGMSAEQVRQLIGGMESQVVINEVVTEGDTVILPDTDQDITLNLETGGALLATVAITLPVKANGRVGQRIFVNSDGEIAMAYFYSGQDVTVNGDVYMFNPGDNCVFYRNKPNQISRITA